LLLLIIILGFGGPPLKIKWWRWRESNSRPKDCEKADYVCIPWLLSRDRTSIVTCTVRTSVLF